MIDLRQVLPPHASDFEALDYAREHGLLLITCNRDDFLALVADKQVCSMNAIISAAVTRSETTGLRARQARARISHGRESAACSERDRPLGDNWVSR